MVIEPIYDSSDLRSAERTQSWCIACSDDVPPNIDGVVGSGGIVALKVPASLPLLDNLFRGLDLIFRGIMRPAFELRVLASAQAVLPENALVDVNVLVTRLNYVESALGIATGGGFVVASRSQEWQAKEEIQKVSPNDWRDDDLHLPFVSEFRAVRLLIVSALDFDTIVQVDDS